MAGAGSASASRGPVSPSPAAVASGVAAPSGHQPSGAGRPSRIRFAVSSPATSASMLFCTMGPRNSFPGPGQRSGDREGHLRAALDRLEVVGHIGPEGTSHTDEGDSPSRLERRHPDISRHRATARAGDPLPEDGANRDWSLGRHLRERRPPLPACHGVGEVAEHLVDGPCDDDGTLHTGHADLRPSARETAAGTRSNSVLHRLEDETYGGPLDEVVDVPGPARSLRLQQRLQSGQVYVR